MRPRLESADARVGGETRFWGEIDAVLDRSLRKGDLRVTDGRSVVVLLADTTAPTAQAAKERLVATVQESVKPGRRFPPGWSGVSVDLYPISHVVDEPTPEPVPTRAARSVPSPLESAPGEHRAEVQTGLAISSKRVVDVVGALVAIVVSFPLWLSIAVGVKLSSPGPVLFRQKRVGIGGTPFTMLKFRTMEAGVPEERHREYMEGYVRGTQPAGGEQRAPFKLADDDRVFPLGRLLRRWSLDELPQLLNVLVGDMSLAGPRPSVHYELDGYQTWHRERLTMKPGLTGLWQVYGRGRTTFDDMVRLDVHYIRNWSILLDLKLLALTIPVTLGRRGAA